MRSPSGWHQSGCGAASRWRSGRCRSRAARRRRPCRPRRRAVTTKRAEPLTIRTPWLCNSRLVPVCRCVLIPSIRSSAPRCRRSPSLLETHSRRAAEEAHRPARGDHRLRRDAVEQVGGAADDLPFDHVTWAPRRAANVAAVFPAGPPPMIRNRVAIAVQAMAGGLAGSTNARTTITPAALTCTLATWCRERSR